MPFTRDWSESTPIDHTLNASWPDYDRRAKVDVGDRLETIISGFASGETVLGVLNLPFIAVSAPSTVTDQIQLYGKVVGGKTELHFKDEDGNEGQATSLGKLNAAALGGVYAAANVAALATMMALIYPVGSIYMNDAVSTNPGTLLGMGTWVAITDKMVIGVGSTFTPAGATGGATTATLTTTELPEHTHTFARNDRSGAGGIVALEVADVAATTTNTTNSTGSGAAFSIMNPYHAAYVWRRTA